MAHRRPTSKVAWPHTVVAVTNEVVSPFELAVACEVFGIDRPELVDPWYRFAVCSVDGGPVQTRVGFWIQPDAGIEALETADSIIIPAGFKDDGRQAPPVLLDALRRAHARGARLMSVCSGAFVMSAFRPFRT